MKMFTVKLPEFLESRLAALARERKTSKSKVAREALMDYISRDSNKSTGSFLELAGDLVGSVEGPQDLSVNKSYMRGYGK